ncbi:MAG: hypothetical protein A2527_00910 [Candidatus Lambdaproteobacteria bacterium RIFOXYD2_FULL_50_16]|uniref:Contractile injection system tube protein N-terminal domain-containing protein n=1 Tax=Candidatus Lambdaproteobacteria bacterium RIFOXYD2_FULL_50_16 TaxID=1817772 RepID=A0A1F6G8T8_9PROT|nr:MAG: hypothetical protein A2527_00910 [Candidatus Lambdaproteobacteria bacterium RIFOXYD2_FULL_50_16]
MSTGQLEKMKISVYNDIEGHAFIDSFDLMFNPTSYQEKIEIDYTSQTATGSATTSYTFNQVKPQVYNFEFLIDGTGASQQTESDQPTDVAGMVELFMLLTAKWSGDTHQPQYCKLIWGQLSRMTVLRSATTTYSLFKPDGTPLRAKINAQFDCVDGLKIQQARAAANSPDMTHVRSLESGDSLSKMTYQIYGDLRYYPLVAHFNNFDSIRQIEPGTQIVFPPLDKLLGEE